MLSVHEEEPKEKAESSTGESPGVRRLGYKRPMDLSILVLAHLFPLLLPVWALLWTIIPFLIWLEDRGPIFFLQERLGLGGRRFFLIKFRSMRTPESGEDWPEFTSQGDPRMTRVGRVMRRLALDELPQVINLWKGDISFVGPRPLPPDMHESYVKEDRDFARRLLVTPGLTGLAQTRLRRHARARDRSRYDRLYIHRASMWLDLKLIALSVWLTVCGRWGKGRREFQRR